MEFSTKHPIDRGLITELDSDEASYGWLLSSIDTTPFSTMNHSSSHKLRASRSVAVFGFKQAHKELQSCLFSMPDIDPSLFDSSSDDDYHYSDAGISNHYDYNVLVVDEASENLWDTYSYDDPKEGNQLIQSLIDSTKKCAIKKTARSPIPQINKRFILPELASHNNIDLGSAFHRSDNVRPLSNYNRVIPSAPLLPSRPTFSLTPKPRSRATTFTSSLPSPATGDSQQKSFASSTPLATPNASRHGSVVSSPPLPSPWDTVNFSHPQHHSCPINTSFNATPPAPSSATITPPIRPSRARANTLPAPQMGPRQTSKLSTCTTIEHPPRTSSMAHNIILDSRPPSPDFTVADDLMGKMEKSGFYWDSDDDEEDKVELPDWITKLTRKKGNASVQHKELFSKTSSEFAGKQKTKSKSFSGISALGGALKRSLRIRRSGDF